MPVGVFPVEHVIADSSAVSHPSFVLGTLHMKVIVISGASSNVGKTTVAMRLQSLLGGATFVKIGCGKHKPAVKDLLYRPGTSFETIRKHHADAEWLLVESNAILHEIQPDLVIYMEGKNPKPSASDARVRADIISGQFIDSDRVAALAARLKVTADLMRGMVEAAGGKL